MTTQFDIIAFYKFVALPDYEALRQPLYSTCNHYGVKGTVLLAAEGINGTLAVPRPHTDTIKQFLRRDERLADLDFKTSSADFAPFHRLKVRLKTEIVTLRDDSADPTQQVGTYVAPEAWNALIEEPDVVLIDTRNDFEVQIGTFKGAENPRTTSFSDFPEFIARRFEDAKPTKVAMFCTGGIRCEKATSYLLANGFDEVYHLRGGILKYLEEVAPEESLWQGECFVFDNRTTVDHNLQPGSYVLCHGCFMPVSPEAQRSPHYRVGVQCGNCYESLSPERRASLEERQRQIELAAARGELHIGRNAD